MRTGASLSILGTRGIPARHGGFETFAEYLATHLAARGWSVTVYCQDLGAGQRWDEKWKDVRLVHIPVSIGGPGGTVLFDLKSTLAAASGRDLVLTLGYNTAIFTVLYRLFGVRNLVNMDGLEWRRAKWSFAAKAWLYVNEWIGAWAGDHLVADHPVIAEHLASRVHREKITTIPYGAESVRDAPVSPLVAYGLKPQDYVLLVARPEPENSVLEVVEAYSLQSRGMPLVVVGAYRPDVRVYDRQVVAAAGPEVRFIGPVYDREVLQSLRYHCRYHIHGHRVGGTNPSLVEALGAGSPVLAHENPFNRWVAGTAARFFSDVSGCAAEIERLQHAPDECTRMREESRRRHEAAFQWADILQSYEDLLIRWRPVRDSRRRRALRWLAGFARRTGHRGAAT